VRLGMGVLAAAVLAACTGDNLFTGLAISNQLTGPVVNINAPLANLSIKVGDSVQVTAQVTSSQGVSQLSYSGVFDGGTTAFTSQVVTLPNPKDTTVSKYMRQSGTTTGAAKIIVQATDILGGTASDTVAITIAP
jgi:hypothetical protein